MNRKPTLFFYSAVVCVSMLATFACGDDGESPDDGTGGSSGEAGEGGAPPTTSGGKAGTGGKAGGDAGSGGVPDEPGTGGAAPTAGNQSTGGRATTGGRPGGGGNGDAGSGPTSGGSVNEGGSAGSGGAGAEGGSGAEGGEGPLDPECADGFWGPGCQPCACEVARCDDGIDGDGTCTCPTGSAGPNCDRCAPGYQDRDDDGTCEVACATSTCNNHGNCDDSLGEVRCACSPGYTGARCTDCAAGYQDNDDNGSCLRTCDEDTCNDHGDCEDETGVAVCTCSGGYTGTFCDNCEAGEQDNDDDGDCAPACTLETCSGNGDCDDDSGAATCTCDTGYAGDACDDCDDGYQDNDANDTCEPACAEDSCNSHGDCDDTEGAVSCDCDAGYAGDACETCDDGYVDDGEGGCEPEDTCVEYTWTGEFGIPDSPGGGVASDGVEIPFNVTEDFIIGDVDVTVSVGISEIDEIGVRVSHGDDSVVVADPDSDCGADNWVGIIVDDDGTGGAIDDQCADNLTSPPSYTPTEPLSGLDGVSASGAWTVTVFDDDDEATGTVTYAKLRICPDNDEEI